MCFLKGWFYQFQTLGAFQRIESAIIGPESDFKTLMVLSETLNVNSTNAPASIGPPVLLML